MTSPKPLGHHENPVNEHCRRLAIHAEHTYLRMESVYLCEGIPHDHTASCCVEHGTHAVPHNGCILR